MRLIKSIAGTIVVVAAMTTNIFAQKTNLTLNGSISGLTDGTIIELLPGATHKSEKAIASQPVKGGKFSMKLNSPGPRLYYLMVKGSYGSQSILLDKGTVSLNAVAKMSNQGERTNYSFTDVKITGSPIHDLFVKKTAFREDLNKQYNDYHERNKQVSNAMGKARGEKNQQAIDSISKTEAWTRLGSEEKAFFDNVEKQITGAITANKDTWWGPLLLLTNFSYFSPEQRPLFDQFPAAVKASHYGKIAQTELYPPSLEGKPVPAFTLTDAKSEEFNFQKLAKGKKYVLLDFWASWCAPCRKSIPGLKELYQAYGDKGFEIVSISTDKKESDWVKAANEEQLPWPSFLDRNGVADTFNVKAIPNLYLIDGSGKVVSVFTGAAGVAEKVKSLF